MKIMTSKDEARTRISAAEQASSEVWENVRKATKTISNASFNGVGIFRDPYAVRGQLTEAQSDLKAALDKLDSIEWPTDADYDHF